jgi:hypothetical protein
LETWKVSKTFQAYQLDAEAYRRKPVRNKIEAPIKKQIDSPIPTTNMIGVSAPVNACAGMVVMIPTGMIQVRRRRNQPGYNPTG